jgi:hypothetical protein
MNTTDGVLNNVINSVTRILEIILALHPYDVLAWTLLIFTVYLMHAWHKDPRNHFNVADLICENGRLSSSKFIKTGSWIIMSYGFILLSKNDPNSLVAYAPLYGGVWVSARVLEKWQQNNNINVSSTQSNTHNVSDMTSNTTSNNTNTNITLTKFEVEDKKQNTYVEHP